MFKCIFHSILQFISDIDLRNPVVLENRGLPSLLAHQTILVARHLPSFHCYRGCLYCLGILCSLYLPYHQAIQAVLVILVLLWVLMGLKVLYHHLYQAYLAFLLVLYGIKMQEMSFLPFR